MRAKHLPGGALDSNAASAKQPKNNNIHAYGSNIV